LLNKDLSAVRDLPDSMRPNVLKALSALAKFTGHYDEWIQLMGNYDISWVGRSKDDIFIDRLNNVQDSEEIWNWIRSVKQARPDLCSFADLMAVSGLRFIEAFHSYNLIISLGAQGKLDSYFNREKSSLEHYRFKELFIRNSKKAFVSFVPELLVDMISKDIALGNPDAVQKSVSRKGLKVRFGDIREAHGTYMTKYLKESEISFLQGRVTSSIFMANYFNPSLIADLQARAFQGIREIEEKIK
jgi:intergrase/recombinase